MKLLFRDRALTLIMSINAQGERSKLAATLAQQLCNMDGQTKYIPTAPSDEAHPYS